MMEVEQQCEHLSLTAPAVLTALLNEFSAVTDYRTLRDSLPGDWHICSIAGVSYSINGLVKPYNLRRVRLTMCLAGRFPFSP